MKVLNLVNQDNSDINYVISKFPDGQQQVKILIKATYNNGLFKYDLNSKENELNYHWDKGVVQIKSRLNNFQDLELIICTVKSLRNLGVKEIHLYTPYFLGSRSDRQFEEGSNNYLKDVICPIINSLNFESVTVLDPHSDVLEACLNNFRKESNLDLVNWVIFSEQCEKNMDEPSFILVSPDAGANKKIYKIAEQIGYKEDVITCSKNRDINGKLTKTIVPITDEQHSMLHKGPYKDFIIIDDICDGGATFINIAKEIKEYFHESGKTKSKIYLIVTHGVFSKSTTELNHYFDAIYTTNSYRDYSQLELLTVKHLNVF
jgi:ribose-phosphate pyrophosphokinase